MVYSVVKSDLHAQMKGGHSDRINDISWLPECDSLFSCSNDKHVIEWNLSTCQVKKYVKMMMKMIDIHQLTLSYLTLGT